MKHIYGEVENATLRDNLSDIINQTFKLLPYKQDENPLLEQHLEILLIRYYGMSRLFPEEPRFVTIMSMLICINKIDDMQIYRKIVLDCCSYMSELRKQL